METVNGSLGLRNSAIRLRSVAPTQVDLRRLNASPRESLSFKPAEFLSRLDRARQRPRRAHHALVAYIFRMKTGVVFNRWLQAFNFAFRTLSKISEPVYLPIIAQRGQRELLWPSGRAAYQADCWRWRRVPRAVPSLQLSCGFVLERDGGFH